jgi:hypothetical protein
MTESTVDRIARIIHCETGSFSEAAKQIADEIDRLTAERDAARAEVERLREANERVGSWLSAALEDPGVCQEMKSDIEAWFAALQPTPPSWGAAGVQMTIAEQEGSHE